MSVLYLILLGSPSGSSGQTKFQPSSERLQEREIPFDLFNGHIAVVKGGVGPIANVNIMLDTGKNPTAISEELAEKLDLKRKPALLIFSNGELQVESVILPRLDAGAWHITSAKVLIQDLSYLRRSIGLSVDVIAGLDVLSTDNFMIDYWRRKIVFGPMKSVKKSVRFEQQRPFLIVKAQVDGQAMRLLVDSGTSGLLLYQSRLNTRLEPLTASSDPALSTGVGSMRAAWFYASRVSLGNVNLGPERVLIADVQPDPKYEFDGLVGFTQLGCQKVWFDFERGVLGWE